MERRFDPNAVHAGSFVILIDTSVFIDFFTGKHTKQTEILVQRIESSDDICTCGLVMTETLQGVRSDKEYGTIKEILSGLLYLPITKSMFFQASLMYRIILKNGKTIRSPIDCIIAALCIEHGVELLHNDKDFIVIAQYTALRIAHK